MKKVLLSLLVFSCFYSVTVLAQTGPGGVGTNANNVLWLDPTRGVTVAAGQVTLWADQSGNANNASPNAVANQPTYVNPSVNNVPSLDFDGTDDELRVPDAASLDLTQWNIFIVIAADLQKDYNAWFVKGTDSQENFEMLSYSTGNIHTPTYYTDFTRTSPSSAGAQVTAGFNIFEYTYSAAVGRDVYKNNTNISTDNENKTPLVNANPLYIGNELGTAGRFVNGDIAECIAYNAPLNSTQKIIVNNYLAAKYGLTLGASDLYTMDNAGNGNYDYDVGGIGRISAGSLHNDSKGSGVVRMLNPSGLGNGEYMFWGHNGGLLNANDNIDVPVGTATRFVRTWRVSEVGNVGNVDVYFDLAGLGAVTVTDLRLLIDTDNDGTFADEAAISGAALIGGTTYGFAAVAGMADGLRFTLGTANNLVTPLPVELLTFDAIYSNGKVDLTWETASETNNDYFTIERSRNGMDFEGLMQVDGAGTSTSIIDYAETDFYPFEGISYYRLKQTDFNGQYHYSNVVPVNYIFGNDGFTIYPNPVASGSSVFMNFDFPKDKEVLVVVRDIQGKEYFSKVVINSENDQLTAVDPANNIAAGTYLIIATSENRIYSKLLVVK